MGLREIGNLLKFCKSESMKPEKKVKSSIAGVKFNFEYRY